MTTSGPIRASDADREHVVEILRGQYSEGRLTLEEFDQRMAAAYEAKTWSDLAELTSDLPVEVRFGRDGAAQGALVNTGGQRPVRAARFLPLLPLALVAAVVSSIAWGAMAGGPYHHHHGPVFAVWPIILIGLLLARRLMGWRR